jgi:hypothetical protein
MNKLLNKYGGFKPDNKSGYLVDNPEYIKYVNNEVMNIYYTDFLPKK